VRGVGCGAVKVFGGGAVAQIAIKAGTVPERLMMNVVARYLGEEARFLAALERGIAAAERGELMSPAKRSPKRADHKVRWSAPQSSSAATKEAA